MSRRDKKNSSETTGPETPKYIVSYSAMMTILLAFFIMMNTLAAVREYGLVGNGLGLFRMSFNSLGLPGFLTGGRQPANLNAVGGKFRVEDEEEDESDTTTNQGRLIDPDRHDLRETVFGLLKTEDRVVLPLDIRYSPVLDKAAKRRLNVLARLIRQRKAEIVVSAAVPAERSESADVWEAPSAWALRIADYLKEKNRVGDNRVLAVGATVAPGDEDAGEAKEPTVCIVLRTPRTALKSSAEQNGDIGEVLSRKLIELNPNEDSL